ncbi:MAG: hypothetical protein Wins2KO_30140 [Winogradskyella sp.]
MAIKRVLLLIIIAFLSTTKSYTQESKNAFDYWLESFNKGWEFYDKQDYTNAITHFTEAIKYIEYIDFSTSEETKLYPVDNHYYLGICFQNKKNNIKAIEHFEIALKIIKPLGKSHEDFMIGITSDLSYAYQDIDIKKSYDYRKIVVENLEKSGVMDEVYAVNLYSIAFLYKAMDIMPSFYFNLKKAEKIFTQLSMTKNNYYAIIAFHLGNYYFETNDYNKSHLFLSRTETLHNNLEGYKPYNKIEVIFLNSVALSNIEKNQKALDKLNSIIDDDYFKQEGNALLFTQVVDIKAMLLQKLQRINEANSTYLNSLSYIKVTYGENTEYFALQNANYGQYLIDREDFDNAAFHLEKAITIYKALNLTKSETYLLPINSLGLLKMNKGNYEEAQNHFNEALQILEEVNRPNAELDKINILNNLAVVYQSIGKYEQAKTIYDKILNKKKALLTENNSDYAKSLMNYGNLLNESGQYYEAETIYKKALSIFEKTIGKNDILYAKQLLSLGQFYIITRQLKKGLNVFNQAIEIYKTNDLTQSSGMGLAIAGKGVIQQHLGEIENSIQTQLNGLELIKNSLSTNNIEYGKIAKNLGLSYHISKDFETAIYYYKQAFSTYKKSLQDGHYLYGLLLYQIAETQFQIGQQDEALKNLDSAIKNFKFNFGDDSFWYITAMISKGTFTLNYGNHKAALDIFNELETKIDNVLESDTDIKNILLYHLGVSHELNGNKLKATEYYNKHNEGFKKLLKDVFTYRNENEKKQFLKQFEITLSWLNNSIFNTDHQLTDLIETGLNNQLMFKGLLLNSTKDLLSELATNGSDDIKAKVEFYRLLRKERENLINNSSAKNEEKLNQLKAQINTLETELVRLYNDSAQFEKTSIEKDWKAIQSQLQADEIALEYSVFHLREGAKITAEKTYGVYLIHKEWAQPKVVALCTESELKALLKNQNPNTLYQTRGSKAKSTANTKGIYELIWSPIETHLEGIEKVYFSPSGLLNQIPFAALDTKDKPTLANQYQLVQLSSTYSLTELNTEPKPDNALFIGGINYEYKADKTAAKIKELSSALSVLKNTNSTRSSSEKWNYLPGTLKEVNTIIDLYDNSNKSYNLISDTKATESRFKAINGNSPNVIHIATHGFFYENPKTTNTSIDVSNTNVFKSSEDPLLRSGLIFSGANYAWLNGNNPYESEDGILNALEISNLDLSNTALVILSACETGLGDIDGSEGVYGLQRAFKMAGVDILMMSLWEVPDKETAEFMQRFYSNWLSGENVRTAFRNTQLSMSKTYKNNPEKWAAFVLIE